MRGTQYNIYRATEETGNKLLSIKNEHAKKLDISNLVHIFAQEMARIRTF